VGELTTTLAGLEKKRTELIERQGLAKPALDKLSLLYEREAGLARLELEFELAKKAYEEAEAHERGLGGEVLKRNSEIQMVDAAIPPANPDTRGFLTKLIISLGAAFAFAAVLIAWGEARRYEGV
jgi:uncharacterized protein involved in exopolysaccharide biosynthesis